jgi:DNA modification methylase
MSGEAILLQGDAANLPLADGSVDLIVTSPPYFALRSYQDGGEHLAGQVGAEPTPTAYLDALIVCTREMVRVLNPSGSIFVNLGDKYAGSGGNNQSNIGGEHRGPRSYNKARIAPAKSLMGIPWRYALRCIDDLDLILRAEIIWAKPNGLPESVRDRVARKHEQWFHFTKSPRYFSGIDEIREAHRSVESPLARRGPSGQNRGTVTGRTHDDGASVGNFTHAPLGKLPGSVWTIATEPLVIPDKLGVEHYAAFPTEWPRRLITAFAPVGGVVLDPFGGTGTTAAVAKALGRTGISVDLSADYHRIADWRCNGDGHDKIVKKLERARRAV